MTPRTKSGMLLGATLLIGILIGALGNSAFRNQRLDQLETMGRPGGMVRAIERVVVPIDEAQREAIRAIIQPASQSIRQDMLAQRRVQRERFSAMYQELKTVLEPEQMERLDEWVRQDRTPRRRRSGERRGREERPRSRGQQP